jgi:hypothetical protein
MTKNTLHLPFAVVLSAFVLAGAASLRADDAAAASADTNQPAPATPVKLKELPPGNHRLLETMTKSFGLTYDQELEIEPLLHDEESVSKPVLGFAPFTYDEKQQMLLIVKHAARRQIRPLLTPEQQVKADAEDASLSAKTGGGGKGGKKAPAASTADSVIEAINKYAALTPAERDTMIAKVKEAASRPAAPAPAAPAQQ